LIILALFFCINNYFFLFLTWEITFICWRCAEQPLLNNLNNVFVSISGNDNPVRNARKDLSISIIYSGPDKKLDFIPSEESPGVYLADIIPSQLGSYSVNLTGTIETQKINNTIPIEDIQDTKKLTFPLVTEEDPMQIYKILENKLTR
jgi:hypothetical protein